MAREKEITSMTFTIPEFEYKQTLGKVDLLKVFGYGKSMIASTQTYRTQPKDELKFMGKFTFPKIESFKKTLNKTGKYTESQISEIIEGLENFPEYKSDKC